MEHGDDDSSCMTYYHPSSCSSTGIVEPATNAINHPNANIHAPSKIGTARKPTAPIADTHISPPNKVIIWWNNMFIYTNSVCVFRTPVRLWLHNPDMQSFLLSRSLRTLIRIFYIQPFVIRRVYQGLDEMGVYLQCVYTWLLTSGMSVL